MNFLYNFSMFSHIISHSNTLSHALKLLSKLLFHLLHLLKLYHLPRHLHPLTPTIIISKLLLKPHRLFKEQELPCHLPRQFPFSLPSISTSNRNIIPIKVLKFCFTSSFILLTASITKYLNNHIQTYFAFF